MTVEEFMRYELPTADTLRQRLTKGEPLLTETDKDALSLPFENFYFASQLGLRQINPGYHDPWGLLPRVPTLQEAEARREKRRAEAMPILEQGRNLLERLSGEIARLADTYGPEAKGLAFDFRGVSRMIDGADMEEVLDSLNSLFLKTDEFSRRCYTGEARPETPATAPATDKPAEGAEATPPRGGRRRGPKPVIPNDCYQTQALLAVALETTQKNVSQWVNGLAARPHGFCWPFPLKDKARLDRCKAAIRENRESRTATAKATKILKRRNRKPKPEAFNEEWGRHNGGDEWRRDADGPQ